MPYILIRRKFFNSFLPISIFNNLFKLDLLIVLMNSCNSFIIIRGGDDFSPAAFQGAID